MGLHVAGLHHFDGDPDSAVRLDEIDGQYRVTIRCNFKNYDDEITRFIDWFSLHIDALPGDFVGYSCYEDTEVPTLLYHPRLFITPQIPQQIFGDAAVGTDRLEDSMPAGRK